MAFSTLTFTKSWENAADFLTYEENEQQVRADLQYLHDEMRDAFNALVARLNDAAVAGDLPIAPVEGLSAATVQEAIEETLAQIQNTAAGQIVNGSITKEKLSTALLERVYGGKMLLAWDSPDESDNPNTDCPLGQLWLRPALTIPNDAAGKTWQKSGCTVEEAGGAFTVTADGTMASAGVSQSFTGLGQAGQAALVHLTLPSHDAGLNTLRVYLNGVETALPEDGWMAASLQSAGALEVQIQGTWPSAQAAGYFIPFSLVMVTFPPGAAAADARQQPERSSGRTAFHSRLFHFFVFFIVSPFPEEQNRTQNQETDCSLSCLSIFSSSVYIDLEFWPNGRI